MKLKPVLLESKDKLKPNDIVLNNTSDDLFITSRKTINAWTNIPQIGNDINHLNPQHIYLIDESAKIKEGDWYYNLYPIEEYGEKFISQCGNPKALDEGCSKIIASTDKYLGWTNLGTSEDDRVIGNKIGGNNGCLFEHIIPQLSFQSIQLLIDYYNKHGKMPDEIEVEHDSQWFTKERGWQPFPRDNKNYLPEHKRKIIKLNSEGTVDITIQEEKMYSKKDLPINEILNLIGYIDTPIGRRKYPSEVIDNIQLLDNWIKENLKTVNTYN